MIRRQHALLLLVLAAIVVSAIALFTRHAPVENERPAPADGDEALDTHPSSIDSSPTAPIAPRQSSDDFPPWARPVTLRVEDAARHPMAGTTLEVEYRWGQFVHMPNRRFPSGAARDGRITTDERGALTLADPPPEPFWLVGRLGDLCGILELDPSYFGRTEPPALVMRPVRQVEVFLTDPSGAPVPGLEVEAMEALAVSPARAWTDDDGVARFEVTCIDRALYDAPVIRVHVNAGHFGSVWTPPIAWAASGATRIHASVSAGAIARITVTDDATPPPASERKLSWKDSSGSSWPGMPGSRRFIGSTTAMAPLPSGTPITFTLDEPGRRPSSVTVTLAEPPARSEVLIPRGKTAATVHVHLVESGGEPVAHARIWAKRPAAPEPVAPAPAAPEPVMDLSSYFSSRLPVRFTPPLDEIVVDTTTDETGSCSLEVDPDAPVDLRIRRLDLGPWTRSDAILESRLEHPPLRSAERRDVTVTLPDCPLVAAGLVVDDGGAPVEGATVTLEPRPEPGKPANLGQAIRVSRTDGAFAFRGTPPAQPMIVQALHPTRGRSDRVLIDASAARVVLTLTGFGNLVGRLVRAPAAGASALTVKIEPSGGSDLPAWRPTPDVRSIAVPDDGSFAIGRLPAGSYRVRVLAGDAVALAVEDVRVGPGADTHDPRLDGVVVGGDFTTAIATVRGRDGVPIADAGVNLYDHAGEPGSKPLMQASTGPDGSARFLLPAEMTPVVRVLRGGYLKWRRANASFPLDVVLSRTIDVSVVIECPEPLPTIESLTRWCVLLQRTDTPDATPEFSRDHRGWFSPPASSVTVREVNPGSYRVFLTPSGQVAGGLGGYEANGGWISLGDLTVVADEPPPTPRFPVTVADCRRALGLDR